MIGVLGDMQSSFYVVKFERIGLFLFCKNKQERIMRIMITGRNRDEF